MFSVGCSVTVGQVGSRAFSRGRDYIVAWMINLESSNSSLIKSCSLHLDPVKLKYSITRSRCTVGTPDVSRGFDPNSEIQTEFEFCPPDINFVGTSRNILNSWLGVSIYLASGLQATTQFQIRGRSFRLEHLPNVGFPLGFSIRESPGKTHFRAPRRCYIEYLENLKHLGWNLLVYFC